MKAGLTLSGDLMANLKKLPNAVNRTVQVAALKAGAEPIRDEMSILAPRDEDASAPHLEDLIVVEVITEERLITQFGHETPTVAIGPSRKAFYGFFQEFGYGPGPAQPFARPAFDQQHQESLRIISAQLWAALESAE